MKKFHELLESLREAQQISKKDLALRTGLSAGYISLLTRGEREAPSEDAVKFLANALNLDQKTRNDFFAAAGYSSDISSSPLNGSLVYMSGSKTHTAHPRADWGEAPDIRTFYGRQDKLDELEQWIMGDGCRMVLIQGMGGTGKTALATMLAAQISDAFEYIFWRSLQSAQPLKSILENCIFFFSNQESTDLPRTEDEQILLLIRYLREHRCLLVLDNFESVLQSGSRAGAYREGYEGYGKLLLRAGESEHRSSILLTAREKPKEILRQEGKALFVRTMHLLGMELVELQKILEEEDIFGTHDAWERLVRLYAGNPMALKLVSASIRELFGGDIGLFLEDGEAVFGDIHDLLDQQFLRLSEQERKVIYWLAIEREPISLSDLREHIVPSISMRALQEALDSMRRRSMIENTRGYFSLIPVISEYITERIIEDAFQAIESEHAGILTSHALIRAQAKDYIRNSQFRLILGPLAERLFTTLGYPETDRKLRRLIAIQQEMRAQTPNYVAGNVLNLLIRLQEMLPERPEPREYDFSNLMVWQAYLQGKRLHKMNFAYADLSRSTFTNTFGGILSVAVSPDSSLIAAGTANGEIRLWQSPGGTPYMTYKGHTDWVGAVAFSPNGHTLASGSDDHTVRLWDVETGHHLHTLEGHSGWVQAVAFSPDEKFLATGSEDCTVQIWDVNNAMHVATFSGHTNKIYSVAFSPDGKLLATAGEDKTVRIWSVASGECFQIFHEHKGWVQSVVFSPDGQLLASGGGDHTIRVWHVDTGTCIRVLLGHTGWVQSVVFSPDGQLLASGSEDRTIRIWDTTHWDCLRTLQGPRSRIYSVAFSSNKQVLVSGSADQAINLWETKNWESLTTLKGYSNRIYSIAFSPDGQRLASGSDDQAVRLWGVRTGALLKTFPEDGTWRYSIAFSPDGRLLASGSDDQTVRLLEVASGKLLKTLEGHSNWVWSVAFSPNGRLLASGGNDQAIRLWEVKSGKALNAMEGHTSWVRSVAFSPDGRLLASGSEDQTVRLWEVKTGTCLSVLRGHRDRIYSVVFSPDGAYLASGSKDRTICLWDVGSGRCIKSLEGHSDWVWSIVFTPDGQFLASGSEDQTVRLWEVKAGTCLKTLEGHSSWVQSVACSTLDGRQVVASGSHDGTIKLWDVQTGDCLQTLSSSKPYEGMNITGVKGLTQAQKEMLKELGATED